MPGSSVAASPSPTRRSLSPYSMVLASQEALHIVDREPKDKAYVPDAMSVDGPELDDQSDSEASAKTENQAVEAIGEDESMPESESTRRMASEEVKDDAAIGDTHDSSSEEPVPVETSSEYAHAQVVSSAAGTTKASNKGWLQQACDANFVAGKPKQFQCAHHIVASSNQPCDTRQEYFDPKETARPVIAHFFGHNKSEWEQIPKDERIYLCRKHYQKLWHHGDNVVSPLADNAKPCMQLKLIRIMLDRIERWRPDATFAVKLSKAMDDKTKHYHELVSGGLTVSEAAAQADAIRREVKAEPLGERQAGVPQTEERECETPQNKVPRRKYKSKAKGKIEEKTPVLFALDVKRRYEGGSKSADDVRALYDWLESKLADETIGSLPAIETLLDLPAALKAKKKKANRAALPAPEPKDDEPRTQAPANSTAVQIDASPVEGPSTVTPAPAFTPINQPEPTPLQETFSQIRLAILNAGIDMSGFAIRLEGPACEEPAPRPTIVLKRLNGGGSSSSRHKGKGKMPAEAKTGAEKRKRDERVCGGRGDSMEPKKRARREEPVDGDEDFDVAVGLKAEMEDE